MAAQNNQLRLEADKARLHASEANEQLLGRIGSDLHDGPVQLLSLATLRLSAGAPDLKLEDHPEILAIIREALSELRNISTGLSLPEIRAMTLRPSRGFNRGETGMRLGPAARRGL
jgi:signal transduction histidine kinase